MKYKLYIVILAGLTIISGCSLDLTEQGRRTAAIKNDNNCYQSGGRLEFKDGDYYCDFSERSIQYHPQTIKFVKY